MTTIPAGVAADLRRLVESEDLGSSFFAAAADHTSSSRRRTTWQALHELEIRTQTGVSAFLERAHLAIPSSNAMADTVGRIGGSGLHLLPYGLQLRAVRETTTRSLESEPAVDPTNSSEDAPWNAKLITVTWNERP
ncbi:hypothetical protein QX204_13515 [Nocardia sp. PE-7]|uniref:hypothetical protein n=1 Tax=Nocardia sp. PE-7 TaxID=3058426 RepID=UPI002658FEEB|nr:hypothetical protein [Nocardia sp. PE-7]WKG12422.1 hypothetical protein QX204_13515 [Nocardia sp. PE-7]